MPKSTLMWCMPENCPLRYQQPCTCKGTALGSGYIGMAALSDGGNCKHWGFNCYGCSITGCMVHATIDKWPNRIGNASRAPIVTIEAFADVDCAFFYGQMRLNCAWASTIVIDAFIYDATELQYCDLRIGCQQSPAQNNALWSSIPSTRKHTFSCAAYIHFAACSQTTNLQSTI
jgi:hypothetical protein